MRVVVIGGGVVGTATAHFLGQGGAEVVLLERHAEVGQEASYANAGSMTASRAGPWASPATLLKTLKGYFSPDSAFRLRLSLDTDQYRLLAGFIATAVSSTRPGKRLAMMQLGLEGISEKRCLAERLGLLPETVYPGLLTVYKSAEDLKAATADESLLASIGIRISVLDKAGCMRFEPNIDWQRINMAGAIFCHTDETADCLQFAQALAKANKDSNIESRLGETVLSVDARRIGACRIITDRGELDADAVIVAAGIGSLKFAAAHGVRLPIYPVKGYSVTAPVSRGEGPSVTISDEHRKVFISPMGKFVRAAGIADIVGYRRDLPSSRLAVLERSLNSFFPGIQLASKSAAWAGLRAMTHDGPPVLCGIEGSGLWFNTGHGSLGWTFACGAGKKIADMTLKGQWLPENPYFGLNKRWLV